MSTPMTMQPAAPSVPPCEEYDDYASKSNSNLGPHTRYDLPLHDLAEIFRRLRGQFGRTMRGDHDGEEAEIIHKAYIIYAVRRYKVRTVRGGDSYCGICEPYDDILRDDIEITHVANADDIEFEGVKNRLNDWAKRNQY